MSANPWLIRMARAGMAALIALALTACTTAPVAPTGTPFEQDVSAATDALAAQWREAQARPMWLARLFPTTVALGPFVDLPAATSTRPGSAFALPGSMASSLARQAVSQRLNATLPELKQVPVEQMPSLLLSASLAPDSAPVSPGRVLTLVLEDTQSHRIVARWRGPVRAATADLFPGRYSVNSPVIFTQPKAVSNADLFDLGAGASVPADDYAARAQLALLDDARSAYEGKDYERSLRLFQAAAAPHSALTIRAYNGQYLSLLALDRKAEANAAFKQVIEEGFRARSLAIKLLFTPGLTTFWSDPAISGAYLLWIRDIAAQAAASPACLSVIGHTSHTGAEVFNQSLSLARSEYVMGLLQAEQPNLAARLSAVGRGWAENIVGSGTDDARDAIDRRVEFKIGDCATRP